MDKALAKVRHERSKKDFPFLKLDEDEYVEFAFSRARVCLAMIFGGVALLLILLLITFLVVIAGQPELDESGRKFWYIILMVLVVMAILIGLTALLIYRGNKLLITNKHVIQMIMKTPVATSMNMIDLSSIEDASFQQNGITQKMFHYGTLRLSTVGDETTYTFEYADVSQNELKEISKLVTEAKKAAKKDA